MPKICVKCKKEIIDESKYCPSCGGKVVDEETHRVNSIKERNLLIIVGSFIVFFLIASYIIFFMPFSYKAIEHFTVQTPYTDVEYYSVSQPYQTQQPYTEWVNSANCNKDSACSCQHVSWLGLGSCDSCSCTRYRTITNYHDVQQTRAVTKYRDTPQQRELIKYDTLFNMWRGKTQYEFYV